MKDEFFKDWQVIIEFPVAWGDMDAFQHVNNARYFTYFENARMAYVQKIGFLDLVEKEGIGPILARIDCWFRFPLTYPDTVWAGTRVSQIGEDRFTLLHRVVSQRHDRIAADGTGLIVAYDYRAGRKAPIPDGIRSQIMALDNPRPL